MNAGSASRWQDVEALLFSITFLIGQINNSDDPSIQTMVKQVLQALPNVLMVTGGNEQVWISTMDLVSRFSYWIRRQDNTSGEVLFPTYQLVIQGLGQPVRLVLYINTW